MNRKYSFKKNHEIDKLVKIKQSVGNRFYAIYYQKSNKTLPQIAVSPTRKFKTAVERNYEKRVVKEIIKEILSNLKNLNLLIIIKITTKDLTFLQKKEQLFYLLNQIIRRKNEKAD